MQSTSNKAIYVVLAAILSFAVHVLLLLFADRIPITTFGTPGEAPEKPRRLTVKSIDIRDRVFQRGQIDTLNFPRDAAREMADTLADSDRIREVFEDEDLIQPPKPKLSLEGLGKNVVVPKPKRTAPPTPPSAPRPDILEIDADRIPTEQLAESRPIFEKVPRKTVGDQRLPSLFHSDEFEGGRGGELGVGMRLGMAGTTPDLPAHLRHARAGDDDTQKDDTELGPLTEAPRPDEALGEDDGERDAATPTVSIDELLDVRMAVYQPSRTSDGWFRIDVSPNPQSDQLKAIPKDVLFLVDRSDSISAPKLKVFKAAVIHALEYLNSRDRFNVVSFRVEPDSLFERYVPVNDQNIVKAQDYVDNLRRGGMTDVYAALAPYVGADQGSHDRPLTVFIFTDGQSTVENKLDNETLIRRIVTKNRDQVSVYSASCGKDANRFLLDLLAYSNRGVPLHEEELDDFESEIVSYIGTHSDVIVADLQVTGTGGMAREIYPKKLPHLYRGETLSIFGRFPRGADTIAVQIRGQAAGGAATDFIFRGDIAESRRAGRELQYDWVAQKAFYLVLQRILTASPEVEAELRALQTRYNLEIPYL